MIHIEAVDLDHYTLLMVDTSKGKPQPLDIQKLTYPKIEGTKGLVISAPVPAWIGGAVFYAYRNRTTWVAGYDPKLKGAVIVVSLSPEKVIGEFLEVRLPCLKCKSINIDKWLRLGAMYPYCEQHTESAPHRH